MTFLCLALTGIVLFLLCMNAYHLSWPILYLSPLAGAGMGLVGSRFVAVTAASPVLLYLSIIFGPDEGEGIPLFKLFVVVLGVDVLVITFLLYLMATTVTVYTQWKASGRGKKESAL
jgi:hypothetical protein